MTRGAEFATVDKEAYHAALPIPRQGTPDDVAQLVLFLASDESRYCTGAEFVVDGGQTAGEVHARRRD
jgi:3alpha(or 20beta)-hydroxysteroid dehydrogenase